MSWSERFRYEEFPTITVGLLHLNRKRWPHTLHTPCTHPAHTIDTPCTHPVHTLHTPLTHPAHTLHTLCTHPAHTLHTPYTHPAHPTHTLHTPCTYPTHTLHTPCSDCISSLIISMLLLQSAQYYRSVLVVAVRTLIPLY